MSPIQLIQSLKQIPIIEVTFKGKISNLSAQNLNVNYGISIVCEVYRNWFVKRTYPGAYAGVNVAYHRTNPVNFSVNSLFIYSGKGKGLHSISMNQMECVCVQHLPLRVQCHNHRLLFEVPLLLNVPVPCYGSKVLHHKPWHLSLQNLIFLAQLLGPLLHNWNPHNLVLISSFSMIIHWPEHWNFFLSDV